MRGTVEADDRRVEKTKDALFSAFAGLVLSRRYDEIRVADIIAAAGVGRSTFYDHYRSKDDMLEKSLAGLLGAVADGSVGRGEGGILEGVVSHFWDNRRFANAMARGRIRQLMVRVLADAIEARLVSRRDLPMSSRRLVAVQSAESHMGLLFAWLSGQVSATPQRIAGSIEQAGTAILNAHCP
jgi:AcrR family transcriptional regulator